jgi:hypothetical protein
MYNVDYSFDGLWFLLSQSHLFWPLFIPLFIFFNKNYCSFNIVFRWIYIFGFIYLIICILYPEVLTTRNQAQIVVTPLTSGLGFMQLYSSYLDKKKVNIAFIILLIGILSLTYLARRSGVITLLNFIIAAYFLYWKAERKTFFLHYFPIVIGLGIIIFINSPSFYSTLTGRLEQRLTEDSRSTVFEMFWLGIKDDIYFGKGMYGTYFCPIGGELEDEGVIIAEHEYREVIENGYLQLVLSGGIIHLVLFLLILFPAALLGIFKSSNMFARASGLIVFLWLFDMFLFGLPQFSLNYIFLWICVGICYKTSIRMKSDDEIRSSFQNRLTA